MNGYVAGSIGDYNDRLVPTTYTWWNGIGEPASAEPRTRPKEIISQQAGSERKMYGFEPIMIWTAFLAVCTAVMGIIVQARREAN